MLYYKYLFPKEQSGRLETSTLLTNSARITSDGRERVRLTIDPNRYQHYQEINLINYIINKTNKKTC